MLQFLGKHKGKLLLIVAVTATLIMLLISLLSGGRASPLTSVWNFVFSPVRNGLNSVVHWMGTQYDKEYDYQRLLEENETLRSRVADMEAEIRDGAKALEENDRLRNLMGLSERRRDLTFETAMIVERPTGGWQSTFKIDKGENKNLSVGLCVVSEEGFFVGVIGEIGPNWASVNTLIDTDVEIGAIVYRTNELGVAAGQFNAMLDGLLRLGFLPANAEIRTGDVVLTSGVNSIYPADLVLGVVEGIYPEDSGVGIYATVRPRADLASLSHVFVITSFDVEN